MQIETIGDIPQQAPPPAPQYKRSGDSIWLERNQASLNDPTLPGDDLFYRTGNDMGVKSNAPSQNRAVPSPLYNREGEFQERAEKALK
ncbi:hypothetical protein MAIT1_01618 [Magnetofaba australis IT-1]|uniref:Uncharacterized protein n=1 Tax=Magnetofaba australis IT-1 TaxID=1434232 RepID=A0A1Y2K0Q3_9PROT|nr:hypothetical protein MAIT1_01618 [Magnetofaba australis IT-1]